MRTPAVDKKPGLAGGSGKVPRRAVRGGSGIAHRLAPASRIGAGADARLEGHGGTGRPGHERRKHREFHRAAAATPEAFPMMGRKKLGEIKAEVAALLGRLPGRSPRAWLDKEIASAKGDGNRD